MNKAYCTVYFFKPSGKWFSTYHIVWHNEENIHAAFKKSLQLHFDHYKYTKEAIEKLDAVCIDPPHKHQHPIQIKAGAWRK